MQDITYRDGVRMTTKQAGQLDRVQVRKGLRQTARGMREYEAFQSFLSDALNKINRA